MKDAIQFVLALLTIVMSGVTSAIVNHRLNKRRDDRDLKRQKLEALFLAMMRYVLALEVHFMRHIQLMQGKLSLDNLNDLVLKEGYDEQRPFDNVRMLIDIYFPHLKPNFDELMAVREAGSDLIGELVDRYRRGQTDTSEHLPGLTDLARMLDEGRTGFIRAISATAERLHKE